METTELKTFSEKISNITLVNLQNEEFMMELTNLFVKIGDIFSICKLPKLDYQLNQRANDLRNKKIRIKSRLKENQRREEDEDTSLTIPNQKKEKMMTKFTMEEKNENYPD